MESGDAGEDVYCADDGVEERRERLPLLLPEVDERKDIADGAHHCARNDENSETYVCREVVYTDRWPCGAVETVIVIGDYSTV